MCFTSDCDWYASVVEDETTAATKPTKCDECRRIIPIGEFVRNIFMQEHEYCRHDPESDDYDPELSGEPDCHEDCEHDFGETFDYDRCLTCDQLIDAIQKHEIEEGCDWSESVPNLEELPDAMIHGDGAAYLAKAESLYPGITSRLPDSFLHAACQTEE